MCQACQSYSELQVNARNYDPTRTQTLRAAFGRELNKRFNELKRVIIETVDTNDAFGLRVQGNQMTAARQNAFAYPRSQDKVAAFMQWLESQVKAGLLEIGQQQQLGTAIETAWTNVYVNDSYKRGVLRARAELRKAGYNVPALAGNEQAINLALNGPFHVDRVGALYTRVFGELRGITAQMEQQISRVLSQGLIDGDSPRVIARKLVQVIDGLGPFDLTDTLGRHIPAKRRAEIMARTEIIRAHHQAMVQEYKNWEVAGVRVKAEFITAQDNRVCPDCQALEGNIFDLDTAFRLIPVHPQCRCIVLPIRPNETILG